MRDYIAWYLIELRRRLTNVDPQGRVEDFLLETRTHLSESIDDMTSRGITEEAATKSAIADFGHPSLVAQAFRGRRGLNDKVYWLLVVATIVLMIPVCNGLVRAMGDVNLGARYYGPFDFGTFSVIGFVAIAVIAWLSRRWCSVPIAVACLVLTFVSGVLAMQSTSPYSLDPSTGTIALLDDANAKGQIDMRDSWLKEYNVSVAELKHALHAPKSVGPSPLEELIKSEYQGYQFPESSRTLFRGYRPIYAWPMSPEPYPFWLSLSAPDERGFHMTTTDSADVALEQWRLHGDEYLAFLETQRREVIREQQAFGAPAKVDSAVITNRLLYVPMLTVGTFCLLALLMNGAVIALTDGVTALKRRSWKRQLN